MVGETHPPFSQGTFYRRVNNRKAGKLYFDDVLIGEVMGFVPSVEYEWSFYNGAWFIADEFALCYNKTDPILSRFQRTASDYPQGRPVPPAGKSAIPIL